MTETILKTPLHAAHIRAGGKMYGADGRLKEVKAVIPESTFARIYQEMINFCKWHGNFDPRTMGTVPNVGLMAQQAEEYRMQGMAAGEAVGGEREQRLVEAGPGALEHMLERDVEQHAAGDRRDGHEQPVMGAAAPEPQRQQHAHDAGADDAVPVRDEEVERRSRTTTKFQLR